jgi:hypothetical protein
MLLVPSRPGVQTHFVPDGLVVDDRLDEPVYESTIPSATEKTDVLVLFDDRNFYVSARLWDRHPERIVANEMRWGAALDIYQNEKVSVTIDTFNDLRSWLGTWSSPCRAQTVLQSLQHERQLAERIEQNIKQWRARTGKTTTAEGRKASA